MSFVFRSLKYNTQKRQIEEQFLEFESQNPNEIKNQRLAKYWNSKSMHKKKTKKNNGDKETSDLVVDFAS